MPFSICVKSELSFKVIKTKNTNKEHCHISRCKKEKKRQLHNCQATPTTSYTLNATSERNLCSRGSKVLFVLHTRIVSLTSNTLCDPENKDTFDALNI